MADVAKLRELLERCEKASGPDREIDLAVLNRFSPDRYGVGYVWGMQAVEPGSKHIAVVDIPEDYRARRHWFLEGDDNEAIVVVPSYTASLDASIALVERMLPAAVWLKKSDKVATISMLPEKYKAWAVHHDGTGATFALAVLSALLRALISQAEGEGA